MAIDSTEWAWRDLSVFMNGIKVGKVTRFTSKTARESEHLHGAGDEPFDVNPGNKTYTGEIELYATVIAKMNKEALALGGTDLTDVIWTLGGEFKATATDPRQTVTVPNVRFDEFEVGGSNNDKGFRKVLPYKSLKPIIK